MMAPIPNGTFVDKNSPGYPYDVSKAQSLLAQSSVPNGFSLPLLVANNNQDRINTAVILKDEWAKIGVNVDIQQVVPPPVPLAPTSNVVQPGGEDQDGDDD